LSWNLEEWKITRKRRVYLWHRVWEGWTETVGERVEGCLTRADSLNATGKEISGHGNYGRRLGEFLRLKLKRKL